MPNTPNSLQRGAISSALSKAKLRFTQETAIHDALETEASRLRDRCEALAVASATIRELSLHAQSRCQERIASVVTRCLESVFGENKYRFSLVFEEKRNQTEARCVLLDSEGNEYDPMNDNGGGIVDVVCFGLRLACLMLMKPRPSRILILDEPFKDVSYQYRPALVSLLRQLCDEFSMQIIMVTHIPELSKEGNVIEL